MAARLVIPRCLHTLCILNSRLLSLGSLFRQTVMPTRESPHDVWRKEMFMKTGRVWPRGRRRRGTDERTLDRRMACHSFRPDKVDAN